MCLLGCFLTLTPILSLLSLYVRGIFGLWDTMWFHDKARVLESDSLSPRCITYCPCPGPASWVCSSIGLFMGMPCSWTLIPCGCQLEILNFIFGLVFCKWCPMTLEHTWTHWPSHLSHVLSSPGHHCSCPVTAATFVLFLRSLKAGMGEDWGWKHMPGMPAGLDPRSHGGLYLLLGSGTLHSK